MLVEFSTRSIDIETELEHWVTGFVEREGRPPTSSEVGKAHKMITLATRATKPADAGLATATLRGRWRARAAELVDVDQMLATTLAGSPSPAHVSRPTVDEVPTAV